MKKLVKRIARIFIPQKLRHFLWSITPIVGIYDTYIITRFNPIGSLNTIDCKFSIQTLSQKDYAMLEKAYSYRSEYYYERKIIPRLSNSNWVCLIAVDTMKKEIAYASWVVKGQVEFLDDSRIYMKPNQFFIRDAFCVPKYRRLGLNTRMDQERINFCVQNGANEIMFQIARKSHKDQNIIKKTGKYCENLNEQGENKGLIYLKKNYIVMITKFGIHNDLFSLPKILFNKIIHGK